MPVIIQEITATISKRKKKAMLTDKAFLEKVADRVYELMQADLRREQERRGGGN